MGAPLRAGLMRDLRARWALEEAGVPYSVLKVDGASERPADYFAEQPFGQVPSYRDETVTLFESGAIVLHIGRNCQALLPTNVAARARATAWLIAALNSVEPFVMQLSTIDVFSSGEEWAKQRRPAVVEISTRFIATVHGSRRKALSRWRYFHRGRPDDGVGAPQPRR